MPELKPTAKQELQWWIILVAALGGIILLIIVIVILYKVSTFHVVHGPGEGGLRTGALKGGGGG